MSPRSGVTQRAKEMARGCKGGRVTLPISQAADHNDWQQSFNEFFTLLQDKRCEAGHHVYLYLRTTYMLNFPPGFSFGVVDH